MVLSKSRSKPSMLALPNGRKAAESACAGPKVAHIFSAAAIAASAEEKPPSVYVAPPIESRIFLLCCVWQVVMSSPISGQCSRPVP